MSDELAVGVAGVGVAGRSDPRLSDHPFDQVQVDLGCDDAASRRALLDRQGHVRPRTSKQVDSTVVRPLRPRDEELGSSGIVSSGPRVVQRVTGDAKLLSPGRIKIPNGGDRALAKEKALVIEASLAQSFATGDVAHLPVETSDELLDQGGGRGRLLELDPGQGALVVVVGEVRRSEA